AIRAVTPHVVRTLKGPAKKVTRLLYGRDGGMVYSASEDGTVRGYSAEDGAQRFSANHAAPLRDLALSPDGQRLASGGEDKMLKVWNAGDGGPAPKPQYGPFASAV